MAAIKSQMMYAHAPIGSEASPEAAKAEEVLGWLVGAHYYRTTPVKVGLADLDVVRMSEIPVGDSRPEAMFRRVDYDFGDDSADGDVRVVEAVVVPDDDVDDFAW